MTKITSLDEFREAARAGGQSDGMVFRLATAPSEAVGDEKSRTRRFVFSDGGIDLSGDSINPNGWVKDGFERNPVALFSHMSWEPPIGRASNVKVQNGKLIGDIEFASADVYPFADTIYRLVSNDFLRAVSVGFKPLEWSFSADKSRPYGIDFVKQILLEISLCAIPCNPNSLIEARSMGIDTRPLKEWAEKILDSGDTVTIPRNTLIEIFRASHTPHSVRDKYKHLLIEPKAVDPASDKTQNVEEAAPSIDDTSETEMNKPKAAGENVDGAIVPSGNCGEPKDMECGLKDPAKCSVHAPETKAADPVIKAGRRISAKTKAMLTDAMGHHEAGMKCIKDILADDEGGEDDGEDGDDNDGEPNKPTDITDSLDPAAKRKAEAAALRASLST